MGVSIYACLYLNQLQPLKFGMDTWFHTTLNWACDYLCMLESKLINAGKRTPAIFRPHLEFESRKLYPWRCACRVDLFILSCCFHIAAAFWFAYQQIYGQWHGTSASLYIHMYMMWSLFSVPVYAMISEFIYVRDNKTFVNLILTHWGQDKLAAIFQTTISNAFSWTKMLGFRLKFHWSFFPKGRINNIPSLVQIMAWRRPGDKPLPEPMMVRLPTHICVARPQWVKIQIWRNR